ncbi:hypothetical protein DSO57_1037461 [Entomophthora muscae]|uniref:Uncharacterized protein n=1 Tax=Entomophthora muscae TaxID=34485 RepID=A0ACC2TAD6_9FUNG|nr:hypothetical protein DSO57_1037461 [Entomophthora muscae]
MSIPGKKWHVTSQPTKMHSQAKNQIPIKSTCRSNISAGRQSNFLLPLINQPLHIVIIDNFPPLETQVQEWDLNPGHDYLRAACPKDQEANHPPFFGSESSQAQAANASQDEDTSKDLATMAPSKGQKIA